MASLNLLKVKIRNEHKKITHQKFSKVPNDPLIYAENIS